MDCNITPYMNIFLFNVLHLVCFTCLLDNSAEYLYRSERLVGEGPEEGHKNDQRAATALL